MKKINLLLIAAFGAVSTYAQAPVVVNNHTDADMSRWVLDVNFLGGLYSQDMKIANTNANYLNGVNLNTGSVGFKNGAAVGGDAQIGFFFGEKRHWGIGTGVMYMREWGDMTLDNFHAEYQSTDNNGDIFRQVVSANRIDERIKTDNFNIPLVLKYKNRFSKHWGFTADAGLLINLQMRNEYKTNASFDYEGIYKFVTNSDGSVTSVYDNAPTPANNDFLITKAQYTKNNTDGNVQGYFNTKSSQGYSVGLGVKPNSTSGSVSYATGSVGFLFQPSVNYFFSDNVALNVGGYYLFQPFNNTVGGSPVTNKIGDYSSVLNTVSHTDNSSYGVNLGLRFFLGKKHEPLMITAVDQTAPTYCGMCDGNIVLNGLRPNQPVTVEYSLNGAQPNQYSIIVPADGKVKLANLCAGSYTGIVATVKRDKATTAPVTLVAPPVTISSQYATNPTAAGTCDGSVRFNGLKAGSAVTINNKVNGKENNAFTSVVSSDNSVTISGLCEGTYTGLVVTINSCNTNAVDFKLVAPVPPPPPAPAPAAVFADDPDISTPILFDFNKSIVHEGAYSELKEVAKEMKEDKIKNLTIDGYTDTIGTAQYNKTLSVKRANAVKARLVKMGVNPRRMKTVGHGAKHPAENNDTAEGRREDRRAVMKVQP